MARAPALLALLLAGCGAGLDPSAPVVEISAPPPAEAPAPRAALPFLGTFSRYAVVAFENGAPHEMVNAQGKSSLRVDPGRVAYEQIYPRDDGVRRAVQIYSFDPERVEPAGDDAYEVALTFRSIETDAPNYAPDKRHPVLRARKRAWGWDLALFTVDTTDVIAAASFGAAPPGQPPLDVTSYARRVGLRIAALDDPPAAPAAPIDPPPDVQAPPRTAVRTASGLAYRILKRSKTGRSPGPSDRVEVHYTGWTTDGKMFDSSRTRGAPAVFPLNAVIAGWTEGLQLMREGDSARLWIPANLAYGTTPRPGVPQGMLVFDVDLIAVR